jgi:GNAT superfamily N-acetyltransferase
VRVSLGQGLDLIQQPRSPDRGDYDWFDLELDGTQVGKARCRIEPGQFTVFSIMVYPEFEGHGFARIVIEHLKHGHALIIADRVRFTARGFWLKVGFLPETIDRYVWHRA